MALTEQQKKDFIDFEKKYPGVIARHCRMEDEYADYLIRKELRITHLGYALMRWFSKTKLVKLRAALRDGFFNSDDYNKDKALGYDSDELKCWISGRHERQELGTWYDAWRMLGSKEA